MYLLMSSDIVCKVVLYAHNINNKYGYFCREPVIYPQNTFEWAAENRHLEIVKLLLTDSRVDPSDWNNLAIIWAAMNGHLEVVKLLLTDPRVDPGDQYNLAIVRAAEKKHLEVVKELLKDPRVDPSEYYYNAIRNAQYGHLEVVKLLLTDPRVYSSYNQNKRTEYIKLNILMLMIM